MYPESMMILRRACLLLVMVALASLSWAVEDDDRLGWQSRATLRAHPELGPVTVAPFCRGAYVQVTPSLSELGVQADVPGMMRGLADRIDHQEGGRTDLSGHVLLMQDRQLVQADAIRLDQQTRYAELDGHIVMADPGFVMQGEQARMQLDTQEMQLQNSRYAAFAAHANGRAAQISRRPDGGTEIIDGRYSTCEPGDQDWFIDSRRIRLDPVSGRGQAWGATLNFQQLPIVYIPYINFPVDDRRQSGVLVPAFGYSSESGLDLSVPYYFNLAPEYDATLTPRLLSRRGLMLEGEFRYLTRWGGGSLTTALLPEDRIYNDTRKLARLQHSGEFVPSWRARVDLNYVSDKDYFRDLGSDLVNSNSTHQERVGEISQSTPAHELMLRVQSFQTLDPAIVPAERPYYRLPQMSYAWVSPLLSDKPGWHMQYSLDSEVVRFARPDADIAAGANVTGTRTLLDPAIQWRWQNDWAWMTPQLKGYLRGYDLQDTASGIIDSHPTLAVPQLSLAAGLALERSMQLGKARYLQTLEPRLFALYLPYRSQSDLPLFDTSEMSLDYAQLFNDVRFAGGDRVGDASQVSLGLTSQWLSTNSGRDLLRLSLGQAFYNRDREVTLASGQLPATEDSSPLAMELVARFDDQWTLRSDAMIDSDSGLVDSSRTMLSRQWQSGRSEDMTQRINVGYRFRRDVLEQSHLSTMLPLDDRWRFVGLWQHDLSEKRLQESVAGIEYESCCWKMRFFLRRYVHNADLVGEDAGYKTAVFLQLQLKGLAGLGQTADSLLENTLPGYGADTR